MRASIIFGPGSSERDLQAFRSVPDVSWQTGIPAAKNDADVVLLLGGDGTIHRHLARLVELDLPVLIVPRGSGNDFARALGLRSFNHSLAAWQAFVSGTTNVRQIDVGVIKTGDQSERYFCTVAGVGLDGAVARRANRLPRWFRGNGGYALTLLPTLFQFAAFPIRIRPSNNANVPLNDGFRRIVLAAFANGYACGGGMKIAPHAQLDDGQLDICVIRDINKLKLFSVFPTVYFGRHLGIAEVEYSQTASVTVETEHPMDVYADGEYVCQTPIEVFLKRRALTVIVPKP